MNCGTSCRSWPEENRRDRCKNAAACGKNLPDIRNLWILHPLHFPVPRPPPARCAAHCCLRLSRRSVRAVCSILGAP